jgi:hypothetical protein
VGLTEKRSLGVLDVGSRDGVRLWMRFYPQDRSIAAMGHVVALRETDCDVEWVQLSAGPQATGASPPAAPNAGRQALGAGSAVSTRQPPATDGSYDFIDPRVIYIDPDNLNKSAAKFQENQTLYLLRELTGRR